ncbi:MAG: DUF456 domain-containing protein [Silanimonas lenta]
MDLQLLLYALAGLMVLAGLLGTVLPVLPGIPLMFAGMLLAAWIGDFQQVGGWTLALLGLMALVALTVDFLASALGAKKLGASPRAVWGAAIGTLAGLPFFPLGLILGPFAGAVLGEMLHRKAYDRQSLGSAARVGAATWIGLAVGAVFKLGMALAMVAVFALDLWL